MLAALGEGCFEGACCVQTAARSVSIICCQVPSQRHCAKYSETVLLGNRSYGSISHWQPMRLRYKMVLMTSRMSTARGRPPGLGGGMRGRKGAHRSSVRSVRYSLRVVAAIGRLPIYMLQATSTSVWLPILYRHLRPISGALPTGTYTCIDTRQWRTLQWPTR